MISDFEKIKLFEIAKIALEINHRRMTPNQVDDLFEVVDKVIAENPGESYSYFKEKILKKYEVSSKHLIF